MSGQGDSGGVPIYAVVDKARKKSSRRVSKEIQELYLSDLNRDAADGPVHVAVSRPHGKFFSSRRQLEMRVLMLRTLFMMSSKSHCKAVNRNWQVYFPTCSWC